MSLRKDLILESDTGAYARSDGELPWVMKENCSILNTWKNVIVCNKRVNTALLKWVCVSQTKAAEQSWDGQCLVAQGREGLREVLMLFTCPWAIFWQKGPYLFHHTAVLTSDTEDGQNCGDIGRRGSWKYGWVFLCSPDEKVVAELVMPLHRSMRCVTTRTLSFQGLACLSAVAPRDVVLSFITPQQNSLSSHSSSGSSGAAASLLRLVSFLFIISFYHTVNCRTEEGNLRNNVQGYPSLPGTCVHWPTSAVLVKWHQQTIYTSR